MHLQPNPDYTNRLIALVNESAFPQHLSMRLSALGIDTAEVRLEVAPHHLQGYGIVHGGVLATLIDTATFWAAFLRIPEDAGLVNVDLKLNYLKPVTAGTLVATGRCLRPGRTVSYAESSVVDARGELVAHGTSTLMTLPGKGFAFGIPKLLEEAS